LVVSAVADSLLQARKKLAVKSRRKIFFIVCLFWYY
jgi:hypothetical protein